MKAVVFEAPNTLKIKEVKTPRAGDNEVVVKVEASGVCASDIHILKGDFIGGDPYPLIPGHEFCGTIVEKGKNVKNFDVNDPVAIDPVIPCGKCYYCKRNEQNHCINFNGLGDTIAGGFAEYVLVPEANLFHFENVSFEEASLAEPLACVLYGHKRAPVHLGDDVLIFGAGSLGLLHLQVARHSGAANITVCDLKKDKLALAGELGADYVINPREEEEDSPLKYAPEGYDVVIDATGSPRVVENAIKFIKNKGTLMVFGVCPQAATITISPYEIYRRDINIVGVFALNRTFGESIKLIDKEVINTKKVISDIFPLEKLPLALEMIENGEAGGKIVIKPHL